MKILKKLKTMHFKIKSHEKFIKKREMNIILVIYHIYTM